MKFEYKDKYDNYGIMRIEISDYACEFPVYKKDVPEIVGHIIDDYETSVKNVYALKDWIKEKMSYNQKVVDNKKAKAV